MRVFCVGNDNYNNGNNLSGSIRDAQAWADFFFKHEVMSVVNATKEVMVKGFDWAAQEESVICYSGHGTLSVDPRGHVCEALCPVDANIGNVITDVEMASLLTAYGKNVTVILDCCHGQNERYARGEEVKQFAPPSSLDGGRFMALELPASARVEDFTENTSEQQAYALWKDTNVALLNACKFNQNAYEAKIDRGIFRGAFSYALQKCFRGQSLRAWVNEAGVYIERDLHKRYQRPKAVGNEQMLMSLNPFAVKT